MLTMAVAGLGRPPYATSCYCPCLLLLLPSGGSMNGLFQVLKQVPQVFLVWGCVGFGGYYALLSYAITGAPGWLVTAGFMTTIVAGVLLSPFIDPNKRSTISKKAIILSCLLVFSLFLLQLDRFSHLEELHHSLLSLLLSFMAAFLWPLGNRKLLYHLESNRAELDPMQRVLGMTIGSLPVQIMLAVYGYVTTGAPSVLQIQSSLVAVV